MWCYAHFLFAIARPVFSNVGNQQTTHNTVDFRTHGIPRYL